MLRVQRRPRWESAIVIPVCAAPGDVELCAASTKAGELRRAVGEFRGLIGNALGSIEHSFDNWG